MKSHFLWEDSKKAKNTTQKCKKGSSNLQKRLKLSNTQGTSHNIAAIVELISFVKTHATIFYIFSQKLVLNWIIFQIFGPKT